MPKGKASKRDIPLFRNIEGLLTEFDNCSDSPTVEERFMISAEVEEMTRAGRFIPLKTDRPYLAGVLKLVEEKASASPDEQVKVIIDLYH